MFDQKYYFGNLQNEQISDQKKRQMLQNLLLQSLSYKYGIIQYLQKLLELSPDTISTEYLIRLQTNQNNALNRMERYYIENFGVIPELDIDTSAQYLSNYNDALLSTLDSLINIVAFNRGVIDLLTEIGDILNALPLYEYAYRINLENELLITFLYAHYDRLINTNQLPI